MTKIASFDIFDTSLIRKCGAPENIFYLLAHSVYNDNELFASEFLHWRLNAYPHKLIDIYHDVMFMGDVSGKSVLQMELDIEADNLMVNPLVKKIIEQRRREGYTIIFISDMYLPGSFLKNILVKERCCLDNEEVFVSCEHDCRKDNGKLYEKIRELYKPIEWIHYGDNKYSDYIKAKENNINAQLTTYGYTDFEKELINYSPKCREGFLLSIFAGYSRSARLSCNNSSDAILFADFGVPFIIAYVKYIYELALKKNFNNIFFISRNGFILKKLFDVVHKDGIKAKELFVSRKSLIRPFLGTNFCVDNFLMILRDNSFKKHKVSSILKFMGENLETIKCDYGISFDYDEIVTCEQEQDFIKKIFNSHYTVDLKKRLEKDRFLAIEYFKQEGICQAKVLLVDFFGVGTQRVMINAILNYYGYEEIVFCNFATDKPISMKHGLYYSFFFSTSLHTMIYESYFLQSENPSTISYEINDERLIPVWANKVYEKSINNSYIHTHSNIVLSMAPLFNYNLDALSLWCQKSITYFRNKADTLDLSPILTCEKSDGKPCIKIMSIFEIYRFIMGDLISWNDHYSLCMTLGYKKIFLIKVIEKLQTIVQKLSVKIKKLFF